MDIGIKVSCQNCLNETYMYHDTHGYHEGMVAGRCPTCSTMLSAKVGGKDMDIYPPWVEPDTDDRNIIGNNIPYYPGDGSC